MNQIKTQSFLGSASSLSAQINLKEDNESERTPVPSFGKMSDQGYDRAITSISDLPRETRVRRIGNSQESLENDTTSLVSQSSSICGRSAE